MINGMIAGLVAITPAAGYVDGYGAMAIGLAAGVIPWLSLNKLGKWSVLQKVDDTFSVLHTHGVAGAVGGLMVGIVANPNMIEYLSNDKKTPAVSVERTVLRRRRQAVDRAVRSARDPGHLGCRRQRILVLKLVSLVFPLRASDGEVEGGDLAIHGQDPMPTVFMPPTVAVKPSSA